MSDDRVRTPLAEYGHEGVVQAEFTGVTISELTALDHYNIRLAPDSHELQKQMNDLIGFAVPLRANTFTIHDNLLCAWLGPDEWLLISPLDKSERVEQSLREIFTGHFATLVKLSSAQTIIRASGDKLVEFLSRGIAIDLHPSSFAAGCCAQTVMAHTNVVLLNHSSDKPMFDLIVRRSYADHLWLWLMDIGKEAEFRPSR